jgi:hypothetical protein
MSVQPYEYSVLRAVPRIERGEYVNVGVVLYCQQLDFLGCATQVDPVRVRALDPAADVEGIAPRSTVVQPGPVHTGLTADPAAALDRLAGTVLGGQTSTGASRT